MEEGWLELWWDGGGYGTRSSLPSMHPLIYNYSTQPHSDPLENLIEHLIWPGLSPLIDIHFSIRSRCRYYRAGCTVVATLFMDILRGNDLLCWQHLTLILSCFYLHPTPLPPLSFLVPQITPPLSLHSNTSDVGTYMSENLSVVIEENLKLIMAMDSKLLNPVFSWLRRLDSWVN